MADRYWVGGNGSWDAANTANWSATSGGAGGSSIPTASDNVFIDANSDVGSNFQVSVDDFSYCNNLTISGMDKVLTFTGSYPVQVNGNMTMTPTNLNNTFSGQYTFKATSATAYITCAGVTTSNATFSFQGTNPCVLASDFYAAGTKSVVSLWTGTLDLAGFTMNAAVFESSNANVRTMAFGSGKVVLGSQSTNTVLDVSGGNMTVTGTPLFELTATIPSARTCNLSNFNETNAPSLTISGGTSGTVSLSGFYCKNLTVASPYSASIVLGSDLVIYGNLSLVSTCTVANTAIKKITFSATSGTKTISTSTVNVQCALYVDAPGATYSLASNLTSSYQFSLVQGTFSMNGYNAQFPTFTSNNTNVRSINIGSGTMTLTAGGQAWYSPTSTNMTVSGAGKVTFSSSSGKTFYGGGLSYPQIENSGSGSLGITGSNTIDTLTSSGATRGGFSLESGQTQTINNFNISGVAGQVVSLIASTSGSQATISKSSGIVQVDYVSIKDSNATGGASWNAGVNSTNISNNTGWNFSSLGATGLLFFF